MIFIYLDKLETINKLCKVCEDHEDIYIDVVYGRQIIDGCSILGVASLMGKIVTLVAHTDDNEKLTRFAADIFAIGGYEAETEV